MPHRRPSPASPLSPQQLAEAVRDDMLAGDQAARMLGIRITEVSPGRAVGVMTVRPDMLNSHAICHGGLITTLADAAFAYACNSYNELTVASGFAVDLLAPGRLGDELTATCTEASRSGRTGVYDVEVHNQRGERIALFRGRSHTARGKHLLAPG
jgi:acyl-CoA thioesterase